jgi:hypothetical protein
VVRGPPVVEVPPDAAEHRALAALAERLGAGLRHFPGGHVGLTTRPAEFGERLWKALHAFGAEHEGASAKQAPPRRRRGWARRSPRPWWG